MRRLQWQSLDQSLTTHCVFPAIIQSHYIILGQDQKQSRISYGYQKLHWLYRIHSASVVTHTALNPLVLLSRSSDVASVVPSASERCAYDAPLKRTRPSNFFALSRNLTTFPSSCLFIPGTRSHIVPVSYRHIVSIVTSFCSTFIHTISAPATNRRATPSPIGRRLCATLDSRLRCTFSVVGLGFFHD